MSIRRETFREGEILDCLGALRQLAGRAVEDASLRDLQSNAADRPPPSHELAAVPLSGRSHQTTRQPQRVGCRRRSRLREMDLVLRHELAVGGAHRIFNEADDDHSNRL